MHKETKMTLLKRMFAERSLALKLALACLLVLAIAGLSLLLPRVGRDGVQGPASPAYAAVDGYILVYDFGAVKRESIQGVIDQLLATVREFLTVHKLYEGSVAQALRVSVQTNKLKESASNLKEVNGAAKESSASATGGEHVIAAVMLPDAALLGELQEALKAVPGLPEPVVTDATWFSEKGWPLPGEDGMRLSVNLADEQHTFTFPKDATTAEMEQAINAWLKERRPDLAFTVHVEQQGDEKQRRIIVKIIGATPGAAKQAPAPDVGIGYQFPPSSTPVTVTIVQNGTESSVTFPGQPSSRGKIAEPFKQDMRKYQSAMQSAAAVLKAKTQVEWTAEELEAYLSNAFWAIYNAACSYTIEQRRVPESWETLRDQGPLSPWPGNPLSNWEPMQWEAGAAQLSPGNLVLQVCPPELYCFPEDPRPMSFEMSIYGPAKDYRPLHPFPYKPAKWATIPEGTAFMGGFGVKITPKTAEQAPAPGASVGEQGAAQGSGELSVTILQSGNAHTFTFARSATEAEIVQAITDWLQSVSPGQHFAVRVQKTADGDKQQLQISIEKVEDGKPAG
jgi:hypothetical protein